jgi:hypothetical protein
MSILKTNQKECMYSAFFNQDFEHEASELRLVRLEILRVQDQTVSLSKGRHVHRQTAALCLFRR